MAKWASANVLDNGPAYIKANATRMILISTYAAGDSYATVTGNALATVTIASTDFTGPADSSGNRVLTAPQNKSATASAPSTGTDLHIAFTDGTANVLWVTDETTNQSFAAGVTVNFPNTLTYTSNQPT